MENTNKKFWWSKNLRLVVEKKDNHLIVNNLNGERYADAGMLIKNLGGVEQFFSKCIEKEEFDELLARWQYGQTKEYKMMKNVRRIERERAIAAQREEAYLRISATSPIEATCENIGIVLRYLNNINWGSWQLPKMTIAYTASQYDCDGKTASAMILEHPIEVDGEMVSKFQVGAPMGYLKHYRRA